MPFHVFHCVCSLQHPFGTRHLLETMLHDSCFQEEVCYQGRKLYLDSK